MRNWQTTHLDGRKSEIRLGTDRDINLLAPRGAATKLKADFQLNRELHAPIKQGETVGTIFRALMERCGTASVSRAGYRGRGWYFQSPVGLSGTAVPAIIWLIGRYENIPEGPFNGPSSF